MYRYAFKRLPKVFGWIGQCWIIHARYWCWLDNGSFKYWSFPKIEDRRLQWTSFFWKTRHPKHSVKCLQRTNFSLTCGKRQSLLHIEWCHWGHSAPKFCFRHHRHHRLSGAKNWKCIRCSKELVEPPSFGNPRWSAEKDSGTWSCIRRHNYLSRRRSGTCRLLTVNMQ